jgi:hypothetical protein
VLLELNHAEFDDVLFDRLTGLDEGGLATVLANRPDVLDPPWPRRLEDVARRLSDPESIVLAVRGLTKPGFQVLRAIRVADALHGEINARDVAGLLGTTTAELVPIVDMLAERVLAWRDDAGRIGVPAMPGIELDFAGLGPSIAGCLAQQTVAALKTLGAALGVRVEGRKDRVVGDLLEFFRNPENVTVLVELAPQGVAELLAGFVWDGAERELDRYGDYYGYRRNAPASPGNWAVEHGLLWRISYEAALMPLEVGLALRGPDYRLPFAPHPPELAVVPAPAEAVAAETATAALRTVDRICALLDHAAAAPIPLLKSGRVGARAVKALAKDTGSGADEIRLSVELAIRMMLLAPEEPEPEAPRRGRRAPEPPPPIGLVPSERCAAWRAAGSADRLRSAICAWWTLPLAPLGEEKPIKAVLGDEPSAAFADVRQLSLRLLTELPDGTGCYDTGALADLAAWHAPLVNSDLIGVLVGAALTEAALLGLTASGASGELARALVGATPVRGGPVDPRDPELVKVSDLLVAGARTTALFGADLTAVVTGPPDAALSELLDRVANRESRGAASTWRFTPASVRAALDGGTTVAELLEDLRAAAGKALPQPLEYLINDVARRHGEVAVMAVGCVIVGDEPGLLTELAAHRKLAALNLRQVAPTVLVAAGPAEAAIAALRAAGYAPVASGGDAAVRVRPAAPVPLDEPGLDDPPVPAADPREHAARLLRAPARSSAPKTQRGELLNHLLRTRRERPTGQWMQFAWHLESGLPTRVEYLEPNGSRSELLVSQAELAGDAIEVWCVETAEYRRLELARISPA